VRKVVASNRAGKSRVRGCALASVSILSVVVASVAANAQPSGGAVVAGQAQISGSGATTLINQTSAKAIINWQSFSVGQGGSVQFNQPSSSAITLNRVTGASASSIEGAIRANGQVWLLNPNGLLFGKGATINVGGLLATSSDIADQDFLAGRYNFSSTGGKGSITNAGTVTANNGGSVVLSAPNVTNQGLIQAQAGRVVLGGTDTFTVDFQGDHLLSYAVGADSSGGKVTNSGKLAASGGTILLTARAAAGVQDAVINNSGMVEATSVRQDNGEIILEADNGTVADSGTLDASGKAAGETGGTVKVLGQQVQVADGARIEVSGDAGGGTALIGGNLHGAGPEPNAQNTTVGKASINASAITSGNGGTVAVYSIGNTQVGATITAKGGAVSGKGGIVETSGHDLGVATSASVTTAAPHGTPGDWLLDPNNLTIVTSGTGTANGETFATSNNDTIDPNTIVTALAAGNVTLQANNTITVSTAVSATSTNTLELDAGGSITLNAGLQVSGGSIKLYTGDPSASTGSLAGAAITQGASGTSIVAASLIVLNGTAGGAITLNDTGNSFTNLTVGTNGGAALFQASGNVAIGTSNLGKGTFTLNTVGDIAQTGPVAAADLTLTSGSNIGLNDSGNAITGTARLTAAGSATFTNGAPTTVLGSSSVGLNLTVTALGALTLADAGGTVNVPGNMALSTAGQVLQTIPISASSLTVSTNSGGITLQNAANNISGIVSLMAPGDVALTNGGPITIDSINDGMAGGITSASYPLAANSVTLQALQGPITEYPQGQGIAAHTISLSSQGGMIGDFSGSAPIVISGGPDASNMPDAATVSLSVTSGGGNVFISSHSPVSIANGGINLNGSGGFGGYMILSSYGSVAVNAPITTTENIVGIDTGGSIQVNAPITAAQGFSGPGAVVTNVNDPNLNFFDGASSNNSSNGITGSGLITAGTVNFITSGGSNGFAGSVGTQSQPLQLTSDTGSLSLAVRSLGSNVYLSSAVGVTIDDQTATIRSFGVVQGSGAVGINTQSTDGATYGAVFLTAAGPISQSYGIQSGTLTLTSTGPSGGIYLEYTGFSPDPGNAVYGQVHLNSSGYADFFGNGPAAVNLGASTVAGDLYVTTLSSDINVQDPAGGAVNVTGSITLETAGAASISVQSPLIAGGSIQLYAANNIVQTGTGTTDAHIQAGGSLVASASIGSISLSDLGHTCSNSGCVVDAGNQVSGAINLFATMGNATIANVPGIQFGPNTSSDSVSSTTSPGSSVAGTLDAITPGDITILPGTSLASAGTALSGTAIGIILQAGGNFINNSGLGQAALVTSNSGTFNIYSNGPANDVFGGLDSGNTAVWNISYQAPITVTGNHYIFAFQPTISVIVGSLTKTYGVDDTAALQGLAGSTLSGLQAGVAGAFQGDTASLVYSGAPVLASAGAAAGAKVGTYTITASLALSDGYALAVTPGTLTVTPATLIYNANGVSRLFGVSNPAFSGTVTGFVNGNTLASATTGTLAFTSPAISQSPAGSYAIAGSGLSAANYTFIQAQGNATALTVTGLANTPMLLQSFTNSIEPPPPSDPANAPLGATQLSPLTLPVVPPPPLPPPLPPGPPPVLSLLTGLSDTAIPSDLTTTEMAASLDGGNSGDNSGGSTSSGDSSGGVVIPNMLVNAAPPAALPPTDVSALSSFGNSSLWQ
jgi:filamentous hemagglutinin family protein